MCLCSYFHCLSFFWTLDCTCAIQTYPRLHFISISRWYNLLRSVWTDLTPHGLSLTGIVWKYYILVNKKCDIHSIYSYWPISFYLKNFQLKKALRGVRVETTHQQGKTSKYKISGVTSVPLFELKYLFLPSPLAYKLHISNFVMRTYILAFVVFSFPLDEGSQMTVVQYFLDRYKYRLQYTSWPCLQSGNDSRPIYLPMEVIFACFVHNTWCILVIIHTICL